MRAALEAAEQANRRIKVFAVEKNPNAVVTLLAQKEETWRDTVEVISSDMREWHPPEVDKADIVISELLGSFGDNELSPECLYSAQHLFKEDAISIPCSYTSWVRNSYSITPYFPKVKIQGSQNLQSFSLSVKVQNVFRPGAL